jgi:hypothetical protein
MAWSRSKIRLVHKKDGCVNLPSRRSCANSLLKAEALHLADRTSEALKAIREAEALAEEREERWWSAELHRLRGVFLTALGAQETQIEASFQEAISTAKDQKSVSLEKRAEATSEFLLSGCGGVWVAEWK